MNSINIKTTALAFLVLLSGSIGAMERTKSKESGPKEYTGHIDKFITEVNIVGKVPERVIISPYRSTGMLASIKPIVEEAPSITLSGLGQYALSAEAGEMLTYKLQNPIPINPTTKNPELYIGIIGENGKTEGHEVFREAEIEALNKGNILIIKEKNGIYAIVIE